MLMYYYVLIHYGVPLADIKRVTSYFLVENMKAEINSLPCRR